LAAVTGAPVRVLIADDQTLFRRGLARLLSEDPRVSVVGEASDGAEAVQMIEACKPEVVLMDIRMPNVDGVKATEQIVAAHPDVHVLVLTTLEADSYVIDALRAGASGYTVKDAEPEAIIASLLAVRAGERVMSSAIAQRVLSMISGDITPKDFYDGLTAREIEVLKMIASGSANKQIAYRLAISEKTVRNHVSNMYEKLHIYDRSQAVLYAARKGLIQI
jgi:DNA-binding NarL/FixJ family response regulator